jgi:adenine phosphoribosyltransferase
VSKQELEGAIRQVPDFPAPGILFFDILPLLKDPKHFSKLTKELSAFAKFVDVVAGIEARGFILASAVASNLKAGFVPIRKAGKLPSTVHSESYGLEYGNDVLEIHTDACPKDSKVLIVDDVLATGGTACAAIRLVEKMGSTVAGLVFLLEIQSLNGRKNILKQYPTIPIAVLKVIE